jgi:hypothetical protein
MSDLTLRLAPFSPAHFCESLRHVGVMCCVTFGDLRLVPYDDNTQIDLTLAQAMIGVAETHRQELIHHLLAPMPLTRKRTLTRADVPLLKVVAANEGCDLGFLAYLLDVPRGRLDSLCASESAQSLIQDLRDPACESMLDGLIYDSLPGVLIAPATYQHSGA